jgi:alcohol dehydrogenase YqhD (iron-dependent ADH family)
MKVIYRIELQRDTTNLNRSGRKPKDYALASNFMWSCTMALNGLIQKRRLAIGQPMIGHELNCMESIMLVLY